MGGGFRFRGVEPKVCLGRRQPLEWDNIRNSRDDTDTC